VIQNFLSSTEYIFFLIGITYLAIRLLKWKELEKDKCGQNPNYNQTRAYKSINKDNIVDNL